VPERERPPLRTRSYWAVLARSVVIGVFGGVFVVAFLGIEHAARTGLWGHLGESFVWFSGGAKALIIPMVAGGVVGLLYMMFHLPPRLKGFLEELEEGRSDPKTAPKAVLVSFVSLIGGASLGP
jgi:hypothetical protein